VKKGISQKTLRNGLKKERTEPFAIHQNDSLKKKRTDISFQREKNFMQEM